MPGKFGALQGKDCLVLDLDGTVYLGDVPLSPAVEFVKSKLCETWFFTNNTSRPPSHTVSKLASMGIQVEEDRILNPLRTVVDEILRAGFRKVWLMATPASRAWVAERLPDVELRASRAEVELCVMAYDDGLDYRELSEFAWRLRDGRCAYWTTQPDWNCPHPLGGVPDVGSFAELFRASTGRSPQRVFGKPDPSLLGPVLARHAPAKVLVVGDRLYTDFVLAERAGIDFALVLTGEATRAEAERLQKGPQWILETLGDLAR